MSPRYTHYYAVIFSVQSNEQDGSDVTPEMLQRSIKDRCGVPDEEWLEMADLMETEDNEDGSILLR